MRTLFLLAQKARDKGRETRGRRRKWVERRTGKGQKPMRRRRRSQISPVARKPNPMIKASVHP